MKTNRLDFSKYETAKSKFTAELHPRGGYITFSNTGNKEFILGLDSFLQILKDILQNINRFGSNQIYEEKRWRDLGSAYYSDPAANTMCTVQTKPMFVTLSKIIMWANDLELRENDPESRISLLNSHIEKAIIELDSLASTYTPQYKNSDELYKESLIYSSDSIRDFALFVFKYFYNGKWNEVIQDSVRKESQINETKYFTLDFLPFRRLIGEFGEPQDKDNLKSSNTFRYFDSPILENGQKYYYFNSQWNGSGDFDLSYKNLKEFFEINFDCKITKQDRKYLLLKKENILAEDFNCQKFVAETDSINLTFSKRLCVRLISSLTTKPFVILTGLTGSGKTKLAQSFAQWICGSEDQYKIVPVGADWTNREPLLGYPSGLDIEKYIAPDSGVLDLMLQAQNSDLPHFLILDEMNLSHVERYFADFLSVMESNDTIKLYSGDDKGDIPNLLSWPSNLFIIGTVNIDESTYMFSPKVLDRANVIEFRVTEQEMGHYLENNRKIDLNQLNGKGASMALSFLELSKKTSGVQLDVAQKGVLLAFFKSLKKLGAEFGYRSAGEMITLITQLGNIESGITENEKLDIAIIQKLLPKLHGSRSKLLPVLEELGKLCLEEGVDLKKEHLDKMDSIDVELDPNIKFKLSFDKIIRMYKNALSNGFTSFAEA